MDMLLSPCRRRLSAPSAASARCAGWLRRTGRDPDPRPRPVHFVGETMGRLWSSSWPARCCPRPAGTARGRRAAALDGVDHRMSLYRRTPNCRG